MSPSDARHLRFSGHCYDFVEGEALRVQSLDVDIWRHVCILDGLVARLSWCGSRGLQEREG
jgi:hypothetical protein